MKGSEIVAAIKGIVNTTVLTTLTARAMKEDLQTQPCHKEGLLDDSYIAIVGATSDRCVY